MRNPKGGITPKWRRKKIIVENHGGLGIHAGCEENLYIWWRWRWAFWLERTVMEIRGNLNLGPSKQSSLFRVDSSGWTERYMKEGIVQNRNTKNSLNITVPYLTSPALHIPFLFPEKSSLLRQMPVPPRLACNFLWFHNVLIFFSVPFVNCSSFPLKLKLCYPRALLYAHTPGVESAILKASITIMSMMLKCVFLASELTRLTLA